MRQIYYLLFTGKAVWWKLTAVQKLLRKNMQTLLNISLIIILKKDHLEITKKNLTDINWPVLQRSNKMDNCRYQQHSLTAEQQ